MFLDLVFVATKSIRKIANAKLVIAHLYSFGSFNRYKCLINIEYSKIIKLFICFGNFFKKKEPVKIFLIYFFRTLGQIGIEDSVFKKQKLI